MVISDPALAKPDLKGRIGDYCSYCERPIPEDVEHVLPRKEFPEFELEWDNFLLACKSCNGVKAGSQEVTHPPDADLERSRFLWPDRDNTARAFIYRRYGIAVADDLDSDAAGLAQETMRLTGFHRQPGTADKQLSPRDSRWRYRDEVWMLAEKWQKRLSSETPSLALREAVLDLAVAKGFWSVWRTVFADDPTMLAALNDRFAGTAKDCFDQVSQAPVPRPGGRL